MAMQITLESSMEADLNVVQGEAEITLDQRLDKAHDSMIRTHDLWKTYRMGDEDIHALAGVTFEIQRNEYVAIIGPSGSGKSTLMNLIGCLDTPSRGQYLLNWKLVSEMGADAL